MKRGLIETLQIAYALALTEAKTAADTAEGIRAVLRNAHGFEEPVPAEEPKAERPGSALDAAIDECQRTAARRAKETDTKKAVKAAAKPCGMGGLCVICGASYEKKHSTQKACSPECVAEKNRRYAAEKYAKAHPGSTARGKAPAAANKAPAAAPAPVSRVDRIKAAAARVDGMPQSVLDAAAEAAASEAL
jgi:hypothetical protein